MDDVNERASAHLSCHILIRDKTSNTILLNKNVNKTSRIKSEYIRDTENHKNG